MTELLPHAYQSDVSQLAGDCIVCGHSQFAKWHTETTALAAQAPQCAVQTNDALRKLVASCKGEQHKFEEWATEQKYDMHEHPLHYLFLDAKTDAARQGWKAALRYVEAALATPEMDALLPVSDDYMRDVIHLKPGDRLEDRS